MPNNFSRVENLNTALQAEFGESEIVTETFDITASQNHESVAFHVNDYVSNDGYVVKFTPSTDEIIAVCSDGIQRPDGYVAFGPFEDYLSYVYFGSFVAIYEFDTGNRYKIDSIDYIGWAAPPDPSQSVAITLINADTDTAVGPLSDGDVLVLDDLPANFNFNLDATVSGSPGSLAFIGGQFGATTDYTVRTDDTAPYAWLGDDSGDYSGQPLTVGNYDVVVTPYSGFGGSGDAGTATRVRFKVIQSTGDPLPADPVVGNITGFNLIDADTDTVVRALMASETLALDDPTLPANFNIEAIVSDPVGHIRFEGSYNDGSSTETISVSEPVAPFAWFSDDYNDGAVDGYLGRPLQVGTYSFTATPYLLIEEAGEMGTSVNFSFDVVVTSPVQCDFNATDAATLITAINDANANGTPDTICLADGTYTLTTSSVTD